MGESEKKKGGFKNTPPTGKEVPKNSLVDPCNEAERIILDPKIMSRISFNDADQFFLKRLLDRRDQCQDANMVKAVREAVADAMTGTQKMLAESLANFQSQVFSILESHTTMLKNIQDRLSQLEDKVETDQDKIRKLEEARIEAHERLTRLEKLAELPLNFDDRIKRLEKFNAPIWVTARILSGILLGLVAAIYLIKHLVDVGWLG